MNAVLQINYKWDKIWLFQDKYSLMSDHLSLFQYKLKEPL